MAWELKIGLAGQPEQVVPVDRGRLLIGTLLSNHVVLRAPDIEPIHAMIEELEDGEGWVIVDLGSESGVAINGEKVNVEAPIKLGDVISIADATIGIAESVPSPSQTTVPPAQLDLGTATAVADSPQETTDVAVSQPDVAETPVSRQPSGHKTTQVSTMRSEIDRRVEKKDILFAPRKAKPTGDVLECVAYWGDTVLEVDLFHPSFKGFESVSIGDTKNSHFISGDKRHVDRHVLAELRKDGFKVHMLEGMKARFRKGGSVEERRGQGSHRLGRRDIVHISYGPIRYFILYVRPPRLNIPKSGPQDPFSLGLGLIAAILYLTLIPFLWSSEMPDDLNELSDDEISIVNIPEKEKPKPKVVKPKIKIAEVKKKPVKRPPPRPKAPKPKPVTPVKKPVKKPKPVPKPKPKPVQPKPLSPQRPPANKANLNQLQKVTQGMASTGAKKPDFKASGSPKPGKVGPSGGARGGGNRSRGGSRKGNKSVSVKGVEGVKNNKASGVNLSKLGLGAGKILSKTGQSAIHTKFKSTRGGGGGGSGSGSRTYGVSGTGNTKSLGLSGTSGAINNFGSGTGGFMAGKGGKGGLSGAGLGRGTGGPNRSLDIYIPAQEPLVSGGLTENEVYMVIKTHLDQIKHCYERLLQRSPRSQGKIATTFVIGKNGRVTSSKIKSSEISDKVMQGCVTDKIRRWKFPQPRGGESVTVTYPFVFAPRN